VSGNFGAIGYDSFNFTVSAAATVDMVYTRGYCDPTFSLFTSAGAHILTNDDSNGLYSHLTQNLNTGVYTMLSASAAAAPATPTPPARPSAAPTVSTTAAAGWAAAAR